MESLRVLNERTTPYTFEPADWSLNDQIAIFVFPSNPFASQILGDWLFDPPITSLACPFFDSALISNLSVESCVSTFHIESFQGSAEELVTFVNDVWRQTYSGKMTYPCWTTPFFEWQFRLGSTSSRCNLIAAYEGTRLAGVLLGTNYPFRSPAGRHLGSQWSWLTIHPDYRDRGITKLLDQERTKRQLAAKSRLIVGFRYFGSRHSMSEQPQPGKENRKFNRKIGFWARVLDARRFSEWHWNRCEGLLATSTRMFYELSEAGNSSVSMRRFTPNDIDACVELVRQSHKSLALSIDWDHDSLRHQLDGNPVGQTHVFEVAGKVVGFINFHILPFSARKVENVAVIDLIVFGNTTNQTIVSSINQSLNEMRNQGAVLALKVRSGDTPWWPLVRTHFVPQLPDSFLVLQTVGETYDICKSSPVHVLWR